MGQLKKQITLYGLTMVAIGSCIGSGIFFTPSEIAGYLSNPWLILAVWLTGSLSVLCGALTFAEIGGLFPKAGGMYAYLREAYGDGLAFLFGWANLTVINTSSIGVLALVFAKYLGFLIPALAGAELYVAIAAILLVTGINIYRTKFAEIFAGTFTTLKLIGMLAIVVVAFLYGSSSTNDFGAGLENHSATQPDLSLLSAFGLAYIGVWFSTGGWQHASFLTAEARNPARNIPLAMVIGTLVVGLAYFLINLAYLYLLPTELMAPGPDGKSVEVAAIAVESVLPYGGLFVALVIAISTFGTVGIYTLSAPRIYHAMAEEGLFFRTFSKVHARFGTPVNAILMQSAWAIVFLLIFQSAELLIKGLIFADVLFYTLVAASVFRFRRRLPDAHRPYRTFGYPVVPLIFIVISSALALNTLYQEPLASLTGIGCLLLGIPLYLYFRKTKAKEI